MVTQPGLADFCLVPQVYNARSLGRRHRDLARVNEIVARCEYLEALHPGPIPMW